MIEVWTDGGAMPNPGRGGWAAVIVVNDTIQAKLVGDANGVTNNQMEITAALRAVESFTSPAEFTVFSDSQYLINSMNTWIPQRGYKGYANADLFGELIKACGGHVIRWQWVRGHGGSPYNVLADQLCGQQILAGAVCPDCKTVLKMDRDLLNWKYRTIKCSACGEIHPMIDVIK